MTGMPLEAGARLSGRMALALHHLYERSVPSIWVREGFMRTRANTMDALVKRGLVEERVCRYSTTLAWEYRITPAGIAWVETQHHVVQGEGNDERGSVGA